jgi:hypothetical protein
LKLTFFVEEKNLSNRKRKEKKRKEKKRKEKKRKEKKRKGLCSNVEAKRKLLRHSKNLIMQSHLLFSY